MKKILGLLLVLLMTASAAIAAPKKADKTSKKAVVPAPSTVDTSHWVVQFQTTVSGMGFDTKDAGITFTGTGVGIEGSVAYAFNDHFSIGLMTGTHAVDMKDVSGFSGGAITGGAWSYSPLELVFQANPMGRSGVYALLGMGISVNSISFSGLDLELLLGPGAPDLSELSLGFSNAAFILSPGLGYSFDLSEKASFFLQARVDINFISQNIKDFFELVGGDPIGDAVFFPFQAGINFNLI